MLFKTRSAAVYGIEAYLVDVEVNISTGTNGKFFISGLPDAAVRESRSRIIASIRNNGFSFPYQVITVNLAPGNLRKTGAGLELAVAVGLQPGLDVAPRHLRRACPGAVAAGHPGRSENGIVTASSRSSRSPRRCRASS